MEGSLEFMFQEIMYLSYPYFRGNSSDLFYLLYSFQYLQRWIVSHIYLNLCVQIVFFGISFLICPGIDAEYMAP